METMTINIINPKAKKLIKDLAALNLIEIKSHKDKINDFLKKTRSKLDDVPSLEEITSIVDEVRKNHYNLKK